MARRNRRNASSKSFLSRFVTLIFFACVVGLAYLVFVQKAPIPSLQTLPFTTSSTRQTAPEPRIVLVNDSSVSIVSSDGSSKRMTRVEYEKQVGTDQLPLEGAQAANGSVVRYRDEFRSPDRRRVATLEAPKADSASVIRLTEGKDSSTIVLRLGSASLRDARIHGWSDEGTILISALVTSTRILADVNRSGSVRRLASLPDSVLSLEARNGSIWYITASPGEGIESDPVPPSELHRVSIAQGDEVAVHEDAKLILSAVPGPDGAVAYLTNDGSATYRKIGDAGTSYLGKRHPLLFLGDGRLVLRDGFDLLLMDPRSGQIERLGTLPEGNVDVYPISP